MGYPIFDAHCDTVLRVVDNGVDIFERSEYGHLDVPRMLETGIACQVFACFTSIEENPDDVEERSRKLVDAVLELQENDQIVVPKSKKDFTSLSESNDRVGIILAIEGGEALGGKPEKLELLKELGVRYITIAWGDNNLTGSAFGTNSGLTDLGKDVVREMERLHILIDVSHASDAAVDDILSITSCPIIASHSNARAVCPSPRNLKDDHIREISERGGAIGCVFLSGFLTREANDVQMPIFQRYFELSKKDPGNLMKHRDAAYDQIANTKLPPFEAIADNIDHLVEVAGIDAVGFGSDFDGFKYGPEGMVDCRDFLRILNILEQRGYSEADIKKISWDNWSRVFSWTFE